MPFADGRATRSSTTARVAGTASRSLTQGRHRRTSSRTSATARCATPAARARRSRSARTTSTRSTRRGWSPRCAAGSGSSACMRRTAASSGRRSTRASCAGSSALRRWLDETRAPGEPLVVGGDSTSTPTDRGRLGREARPTAGPTSREPERAALARAARLGPRRRLPVAAPESRAASRGGTTGRGCSTRTSGCGSTTCYLTEPVAARVGVGRDRPRGAQGPADPVRPRARRLDLDEAGTPFDAGWTGALERIAARTKPRR